MRKKKMSKLRKNLWLLCPRICYNDAQTASVSPLIVAARNHSTSAGGSHCATTFKNTPFVPTNRLAPRPRGLSSFLTSKSGVSAEGKHHTRTTIAPLKHEKSLFIFDRLPTCNGRINKQLASARTGGQQPRLWRWAGLQAAVELRLRWHTLSSTQTPRQSIELSSTLEQLGGGCSASRCQSCGFHRGRFTLPAQLGAKDKLLLLFKSPGDCCV